MLYVNIITVIILNIITILFQQVFILLKILCKLQLMLNALRILIFLNYLHFFYHGKIDISEILLLFVKHDLTY